MATKEPAVAEPVIVWQGIGTLYQSGYGHAGEVDFRVVYITKDHPLYSKSVSGHKDDEGSIYIEYSTDKDSLGQPIWRSTSELPKQYFMEAIRCMIAMGYGKKPAPCGAPKAKEPPVPPAPPDAKVEEQKQPPVPLTRWQKIARFFGCG